MTRQYFADTLVDPLGVDYTTITATSETVLIATALTPIGANEPRAGKIYELIVGGTATTGTAGTLIIQPRFGTTIGGVSLGASPTQNYVPSITTPAFIFRFWLVFRQIQLPGANSLCMGHGVWISNGAAATAASSTVVTCGGTANSSVDVSVASALWIGVTFSVAPSVIPKWHIWRSLN